MEELVVTRLWMAGVVGMMAIFGVVSAVGYARLKSREASSTESEGASSTEP